MVLKLVQKVVVSLSFVGGAFCLQCEAQDDSPSGDANSVLSRTPVAPQEISASGNKYPGHVLICRDFVSNPSEPVQESAAEELKIADVDLPAGTELSEYPNVCFSDVNRRDCRWAVVEKYVTSTSHVDFAQTGDALWLKGDDVMTTVELPFEFSFFGRAFTSVCVGSNGCLSFGERRNPCSWIPCEWGNIAFCGIVALGADLTTQSETRDDFDVYMEYGEDCVRFRWLVAALNGDEGESELNFAITLNADSSFWIDYGECRGLADSVAIGATRDFLTKELLHECGNVPASGTRLAYVYRQLPPGLVLSEDGVLSGRPVRAGHYEFDVRASQKRDDFECCAWRSFAIAVEPCGVSRPRISYCWPECEKVLVGTGGQREFGLCAVGDDAVELTYDWYVDGVLVLSGEDSWLDLDASGMGADECHAVSCFVNDGTWNGVVVREWRVEVSDVFYVSADAGNEDWEYCGDGSEEFPFRTIAEALEFVGPGNTIVVYGGTYDPVWLNREVRIESAFGPESTTIEGNGCDVCVGADECLPERPTLRGFTIRGGTTAASGVRLDHCLVAGCGRQEFADNPQTLFDNVSLSRCTVFGNVGPDNALSGICDFEHCVFWQNQPVTLNDTEDPCFVDAKTGDFRLRAMSPWVSDGVAAKGAFDDAVEGLVVSVEVEGSGILWCWQTGVFDAGSDVEVFFTARDADHGVERFEVNVVPMELPQQEYEDGASVLLENLQGDVRLTIFFRRATYFVSVDGNGANDGLSRDSALRTLQEAVDRTFDGDRILVADGTYESFWSLNRKIVIESENGYRTTMIDVSGEDGGVCLGGPEELPEDRNSIAYGDQWRGTNTVLRGFSICNGRSSYGAGVMAGTVERCLIADNEAQAVAMMLAGPNGMGGGAFNSVLRNCTIVGNAALSATDGCQVFGGQGGGTFGCQLFNCIEWDNLERESGGSSYKDCCREDPLFANRVGGDYRLLPNSPGVVDGRVTVGCDLEIAGHVPEMITLEIGKVSDTNGVDLVCVTSVVVKAGMKAIPNGMFSTWPNLVEVTIEEGVERIGTSFNYCPRLRVVRIPSTVKNVGHNAFAFCGELRRADLPDGITEIQNCTFSNCTNLENTVIPDSVRWIGEYAYIACTNLREVTVGAGVTNVGKHAFNGCMCLRDVTFRGTVTEFKSDVFSGCKSLLRVTFKGNAPLVVGNHFYHYAPATLTTCVPYGSTGWAEPGSTALPEKWPVGNSSPRAIRWEDEPEGIYVAQGDVTVPVEWVDRYPTIISASGGDRSKVLASVGANGLPLWQSYVADLDPTNPESKFRAFITIENGVPKVTWDPDLGNVKRTYRTFGTTSLGASAQWDDLTGKSTEGYNFFKVKVELPK